MNTRRLAGSRRNKHLPIARTTHLREIRKDGWPDRLAYPADYKRKPDHTARAVDIHAIWPPLTLDDSTAKQRKAAEAGARGVSAKPLLGIDRINRYIAQNLAAGRRELTARQRRQVDRQSWLAGLAQLGA